MRLAELKWTLKRRKKKCLGSLFGLVLQIPSQVQAVRKHHSQTPQQAKAGEVPRGSLIGPCGAASPKK